MLKKVEGRRAAWHGPDPPSRTRVLCGCTVGGILMSKRPGDPRCTNRGLGRGSGGAPGQPGPGLDVDGHAGHSRRRERPSAWICLLTSCALLAEPASWAGGPTLSLATAQPGPRAPTHASTHPACGPRRRQRTHRTSGPGVVPPCRAVTQVGMGQCLVVVTRCSASSTSIFSRRLTATGRAGQAGRGQRPRLGTHAHPSAYLPRGLALVRRRQILLLCSGRPFM